MQVVPKLPVHINNIICMIYNPFICYAWFKDHIILPCFPFDELHVCGIFLSLTLINFDKCVTER